MTRSPATVFVATCDLSAHVRGRAAPISRLNDVLASGVGWVPANLGITATGHLIEDNQFGALGDLRLSPDTTTRCTVPADDEWDGVELYLADQTQVDGGSWPCCPRTFLKEAVADLAVAGLQMHAAFEHEFMIRNAPATQPFTWQRARAIEPFGSRLVRLLEATGLEPETWLPEFGHGQFEITVRPTSALAAADRAILLRELVRDLARRHRQEVTFAPIPDPDDVGNGVHVHFSLHDLNGSPVLLDQSRPGRLSELGARFAAGILRHTRALTAFTAASPVSFQRLIPHRWSAGGVYLAEQDREALLRICPTPGSSDEADIAAKINVEYRAADATANPWLLVGVLIRAGLHGLRAGYDPAELGVTDDGTTEAHLPTSLGDALTALDGDEVVTGWFDPRLVQTYASVKRADVALLAGFSESEQCKRVADVY